MTTSTLSTLLAALALGAGTRPCVAQTHSPSVTVITGTLLGSDGAPMKLAHVHVYPTFRRNRFARATADRDGHFAIATTGSGLFLVQFTGVDHYSATIPLVLAAPATIALDVRLKHYAYTDTLERVLAVGDWNGFSPGSAKPLVRQPDGRYTLEVDATADTLAYQLIGLEATGGSRRSINGPQTEWSVYDNRSDYRSVIRAHNGHATIVLDPAALDRRQSELAIVFRNPGSPAARQYELNHSWDVVRQAYFDSSRAQYQRHDAPHFDWAPAVARQSAALARERDPLLRQILLLQLLDAAQLDATIGRSVAQRIVGEVPPSSPLWTDPIRTPWMISQAFEIAAGVTGDRVDTASSLAALAYLDSAIAAQPDSELQAMTLRGARRIARAINDDARANDYYTRLVTDYPYSSWTALVKSQVAPRRVWRAGAQVPAFHLAALDDTSVTYTPASLAGKVYLLDFWATWCGPCVGEMKYLQAAHDSLASRGLEILSVSLDRTPADVRRFRTGAWKMPWLQAYVSGASGDPQMRDLEITILPRTMLIGRDGKILAVDEELRGDALLPTLRHALEGQEGR